MGFDSMHFGHHDNIDMNNMQFASGSQESVESLGALTTPAELMGKPSSLTETKPKGGSVIQDALNWAADTGDRIGASGVGKKAGIEMNKALGSSKGDAPPTSITTRAAGTFIAGLGVVLLATVFTVSHVAGIAAGIMLTGMTLGLYHPLSMAITGTLSFIDAGAHAPLVTEPIGAYKEFDAKTTNFMTKTAAFVLGTAGAAVVLFAPTALSTLAADAFVGGIAAKAVIYPSMFTAGYACSIMIAYGKGMADAGAGENLDNYFGEKYLQDAAAYVMDQTGAYIESMKDNLGLNSVVPRSESTIVHGYDSDVQNDVEDALNADVFGDNSRDAITGDDMKNEVFNGKKIL
jgi:hypothetical protein